MSDSDRLMDRLSVELLAGKLCDRAIVGLLLRTRATVPDIVAMQVRDYHREGDRSWVRLLTVSGFELEPIDRRTQAYIDEYLAVVQIEDAPESPLFRHLPDTGTITSRPTSVSHVRQLVRMIRPSATHR
jgi:hypothetical protein